MKTVEAGQFAANLFEYLRDSKSETIIVTQDGKPCALVQGLDYDEEQLQLINSRQFWTMIEERRQRPTIPWEVAKKRLEELDDEQVD
jgi:antitoxin (DNA-binding transcriptional repressor) of toxin-antitoxin stability system